MKKLGIVLVSSALTAVFAMGSALAQPTFTPTHLVPCTFTDGNDFSDLQGVIDGWNEWADESGIDDYTAILLQPFFRNAQFPWDYIWYGLFADGEAMGSGFNQWVNQSGDLPEQFAEVADCPAHLGLSSVTLKAPTGEGDGVEDGGNFIIEISNCTVHENRTGPEAAAGIREWIEYLTENGSNSNHSLLLPGPGEATDASYSFKWVMGYSSWISLGAEYEISLNNGGIGRYNDIFGRLMDCDSSRIYNGSFIREAGA